MQLSVLTTLLAVCLLAFSANVNSKSIEVDSVEIGDGSISIGDIGIDVIESSEESESTAVPESTEAPETTDAPETTEAPESSGPPQFVHQVPDARDPIVLNIEEVHKFVKDLMETVEQMMVSVVDSVYEGKPLDIHPHKHQHQQHQQEPNQQTRLHSRHHRHHREHQSEDFSERDHVPIQPRTFNTLWWMLKSILKTLRGINCTIKGVVNVKESTEQMLTNFQVCGVEATKQVQAVIDSAQKVLSLANDIISINDNVCENPDYLSDDVDASVKASSKCVKQLRSKVLSLNSQISTTVKLAKKVPSDAGDCVTTTFSAYQEAIVDFPNFVKSCAKL